MTVVAAIFVPLVLLYQGWSYYVFRARVTGREVESPVEVLAHGSGTPAR
jgi:cytochrome d ubiquinol oxidase subunit II